LQFKFRSVDKLLETNPWALSFSLHGFAVIMVYLIVAPWSIIGFGPEELDIAVIEAPVIAPEPLREIKNPQIKQEKIKTNTKKVFGVSPKAFQDTNGLKVKKGNTVAKTPDQKILNKNDLESLPIPVEEYLVSKMPKLVTEFKIPYPQKAKNAEIEGPVVMSLLIDAKGTVRDAKLIKGPGYGLNEAAVLAIKKFKFQPAFIGDKTVAVKIRYIYRFVLER